MNVNIYQQPSQGMYVPACVGYFFLYAMGGCLVLLILASSVNSLLGNPDISGFGTDPVKERLIQIEMKRIEKNLLIAAESGRKQGEQARLKREAELKKQKQEKGNP